MLNLRKTGTHRSGDRILSSQTKWKLSRESQVQLCNLACVEFMWQLGLFCLQFGLILLKYDNDQHYYYYSPTYIYIKRQLYRSDQYFLEKYSKARQPTFGSLYLPRFGGFPIMMRMLSHNPASLGGKLSSANLKAGKTGAGANRWAPTRSSAKT